MNTPNWNTPRYTNKQLLWLMVLTVAMAALLTILDRIIK